MAPSLITGNLMSAYRSARLTFRPVEYFDPQTLREFVARIPEDAVNHALMAQATLKPFGLESPFITSIIEQLTTAYLAVILFDMKGSGPVGPIGYMYIKQDAQKNPRHNADLTIALLPAYQSQGYGREAVNWALDWAFRFGQFHRVGLRMVSYNDPMIRVCVHLGFKSEGRLRESIWHDRKWYDLLLYGMLESEWAKLRKRKE